MEGEGQDLPQEFLLPDPPLGIMLGACYMHLLTEIQLALTKGAAAKLAQ